MNISEKLKAIRNAEGLTQIQLCEVIDISISSLKKIEAGYHEPSITTLSKITKHPRFEKYGLWLISDKTIPEAGQISPALAHIGPERETSPRSDEKIG